MRVPLTNPFVAGDINARTQASLKKTLHKIRSKDDARQQHPHTSHHHHHQHHGHQSDYPRRASNAAPATTVIAHGHGQFPNVAGPTTPAHTHHYQYAHSSNAHAQYVTHTPPPPPPARPSHSQWGGNQDPNNNTTTPQRPPVPPRARAESVPCVVGNVPVQGGSASGTGTPRAYAGAASSSSSFSLSESAKGVCVCAYMCACVCPDALQAAVMKSASPQTCVHVRMHSNPHACMHTRTCTHTQMHPLTHPPTPTTHTHSTQVPTLLPLGAPRGPHRQATTGGGTLPSSPTPPSTAPIPWWACRANTLRTRSLFSSCSLLCLASAEPQWGTRTQGRETRVGRGVAAMCETTIALLRWGRGHLLLPIMGEKHRQTQSLHNTKTTHRFPSHRLWVETVLRAVLRAKLCLCATPWEQQQHRPLLLLVRALPLAPAQTAIMICREVSSQFHHQ